MFHKLNHSETFHYFLNNIYISLDVLDGFWLPVFRESFSSLQAVDQSIQVGSEYLQRRRRHDLSGQPVPGLCHPHRNEMPSHIHRELLVLRFVPVASHPVTGRHWKESGCNLLIPSLQTCICIDEVSPQSSLFQAEAWKDNKWLWSWHHNSTRTCVYLMKIVKNWIVAGNPIWKTM